LAHLAAEKSMKAWLRAIEDELLSLEETEEIRRSGESGGLPAHIRVV
jgi:hypothetical protein